MTYPILDFDGEPEAILEPGKILRRIDIAERAVLCFFRDVIDKVVAEYPARTVLRLKSEMGPNPVYEIDYQGQRLVIFHPGVGAPLAGGFLDELIALGCRQFIAAGGAGVLDSRVTFGQVVVPTAAVRDEGLSYHYLPPGQEAAASPAAVAAIEAVLARHHIPYVKGKTWTTDAIYRETRTRMAKRVAEGCLTVEMEAAAFFAVAQFRGVTFGQMLYGGDDLTGDAWDGRAWQDHSGREKLFWLAAEAVLHLPPSTRPTTHIP